MVSWSSAWQGFLNLFLEGCCPLCHRSTRHVFCLDCLRQIEECRLSEPVPSLDSHLICCGWGEYGGGLKRAIAAFKYNHHPELGHPLGHWLGQAWRQLPNSQRWSRLNVIPIPLHLTKLQKRGYNQAELLAEGFCRETGLPLLRHGLQRIRATEAMYGLSPQQRHQNVTEAFQLGPDLRGAKGNSPVLIVDDIYTTGATVRAAIDTLKESNIQVVGVAALAIALAPKRINMA